MVKTFGEIAGSVLTLTLHKEGNSKHIDLFDVYWKNLSRKQRDAVVVQQVALNGRTLVWATMLCSGQSCYITHHHLTCVMLVICFTCCSAQK